MHSSQRGRVGYFDVGDQDDAIDDVITHPPHSLGRVRLLCLSSSLYSAYEPPGNTRRRRRRRDKTRVRATSQAGARWRSHVCFVSWLRRHSNPRGPEVQLTSLDANGRTAAAPLDHSYSGVRLLSDGQDGSATERDMGRLLPRLLLLAVRPGMDSGHRRRVCARGCTTPIEARE